MSSRRGAAASSSSLPSSLSDSSIASLLASYAQTLKTVAAASKSKANLVKLESQINELAENARQRTPPALNTTAELVQVVAWKLTRGKTRPNLLKWAGEHKDATVKNASSEAAKVLRETKDVAKAIKPLCELKGIGPATAAYVLAILDESVPVMSDEALEMTGTREYTEKRLKALVNEIQAIAKRTQSCVADVEKALFVMFHGGGERESEDAPAAKKQRKA
ncbi:hypothetical protein RI054_09g49420 [Pseudoscourfieldia marina]